MGTSAVQDVPVIRLVVGDWPGGVDARYDGPLEAVKLAERVVNRFAQFESGIRTDKNVSATGVQTTLETAVPAALASLAEAESKLASAQQEATKLEEMLGEKLAPVDASEKERFREIRTLFSAVKPDERGLKVLERIHAGDLEFARAILAAPASFPLFPVDTVITGSGSAGQTLTEWVMERAGGDFSRKRYPEWRLKLERIGRAEYALQLARTRIERAPTLMPPAVAARDADEAMAARLVSA